MISILAVVAHILLILVPLLIAVAFLTLAERKIMASVQRRKGPSVWGYCGLLQPFLDGFKLILKEPVRPSRAAASYFVAAPGFTFLVALMAWAVLPDADGIALLNIQLAAMYLLGISSFGVYGIVIAGWSSGSSYAFLGCCRAIAQMISYELCMSLATMIVAMVIGTYSLSNMIQWQYDSWTFFVLIPVVLIWFVCALAETNRAPFDLAEAESELVAGYHVEYSAMGFAMFFLAEYTNMFTMSLLCSIMFLGGGAGNPFLWAFSMTAIVCMFVMVRAVVPRYRFDQLMRLGWKTLLVLILAYFLFMASVIVTFETWPLF